MSTEKQELSRNVVRCIARFERLRRRYLNEHLRPYKIQGPMFLIILYLDKHPGTDQDTLVDFLGIDKSGVARKCRRLEDLGYIKRKQSQKDRRQNELFLTKEGTKLLPVIRDLLEIWHSHASEGISEADQKKVLVLLEQMLNNVVSKKL